MKGKMFLTIGIVLLAIIILVGASYLFVLSGAIFSFGSNPPEPEIKYGEFPIIINYEVDGEVNSLEDTVICEFDGFESLGAAGKYRKWKSELKSGSDSLILQCKGDGNLVVEIAISYGMPEYYMGDFKQSKEEYERAMMDSKYIGCVKTYNGIKTSYSITKEEAWEKYKLKIIDIQYSEPIENSFK